MVTVVDAKLGTTDVLLVSTVQLQIYHDLLITRPLEDTKKKEANPCKETSETAAARYLVNKAGTIIRCYVINSMITFSQYLLKNCIFVKFHDISRWSRASKMQQLILE